MVIDHKTYKLKYQFSRVECPEPVATSTSLGTTLSGAERVEGRWIVYIAEYFDNSLYCGCTNNIVRRLYDHNQGLGAEWTAKRTPVQLVYIEIHNSLLSARRRERQIKGWSRKKKIKLIFGEWQMM